MHYFTLIFGLVCVGILGYIIWTNIQQWNANSDLTGFDRILATARGSATIMWNKLVALVAAGIGGVASLSDFFGMTELRDWFNAHISDAKTLSSVLLVIAGLGIVARLRTLGQNATPLQMKLMRRSRGLGG